MSGSFCGMTVLCMKIISVIFSQITGLKISLVCQCMKSFKLAYYFIFVTDACEWLQSDSFCDLCWSVVIFSIKILPHEWYFRSHRRKSSRFCILSAIEINAERFCSLNLKCYGLWLIIIRWCVPCIFANSSHKFHCLLNKLHLVEMSAFI